MSLNLLNTKKNEESKLDVDVCLVSIGCHAFTGGLGLENTDVTMNERGQVITNSTW